MKICYERQDNARFNILLPYIQGKDVLDIGSAGGLEDYRPFFLELIKQNAKSVVGIDINKEAVELRRKRQCYDIVYGNAENYNFNKKFDVIVAYEVIEHLSNVGLFLRNMKKHLKEGGLLLIETDNAYAIRGPLLTFIQGRYKMCEEHTSIFDESTLKEHLRRAGLKPIEFKYYGLFYHENASLFGNILLAISFCLSKIRRRMNSNILSISKNVA